MTSNPNGGLRPALTIQSVDINRTEGVAQAFRIDDMASGINLVHGPNGIGKSRTAFAIQAVIWPDRSTSRSELVARLMLNENVWTVDVTGKHARYQRNGTAASAPGLSGIPSSQSDRYILTLHDLLSADNHDFARIIQNEASGGFDLNAIRKHMRLESRPKPQATRPGKALQDARAAAEDLRRHDRQLQEQERSLGPLQQQLDAAVTASQTVRWLKYAREYADAVQALRDAEVERATFPDPIGIMRGDEYADVVRHTSELEEARARRQEIDLDLARLRKELESTGFEAKIPSATFVNELRQRLADVRDREGDVRRAGELVAGLETRLHASRGRIAAEITDEQLQVLNSEGLRRLSDLTRQIQGGEAQAYAESTLLKWLGSTDAPADLEALLKGTDILQHRLRLGNIDSASERDARVKWTLLAAALLIAFEAMWLAVAITPALGVIALGAVPAVWLALRVNDRSATVIVDNLRREYDHLGLDAPVSWTPENVRPELDALQDRLATARLQRQKADHWASLTELRQEAESKIRELDQARSDLLKAIGVVPGDADPESIRQIADALDAWREAGVDLAAQQAVIERALVDFDEGMRAINALFVSAGARAVTSVHEASAMIQDIADRGTRAENLRMQIVANERQLGEQVTPQVERLQRHVAVLYEELGLEVGDGHTLSALCDRVAPCRDAQQRVDGARIALNIARSRLDEAPGYLMKTQEEIDRELLHAEELASKQQGLQERISDIRAKLEQARRQNELEGAIARETQAFDSLRHCREQDYVNLASWNLIEFVQDQHQILSRPPVLEAADELFSRFTSGAYCLEVGEGSQPEFRAIVTTTHWGYGLNELSSGTRVQLLLAVRLAFIEQAEDGPRLPVILDEALGNTDDIRANAIIDAAIEIARGGRQVIYFTAQQDEVAKWSARVAEQIDGPPCRVHDLGAIRGKASALYPVRAEWTPPIVPEISVPAGTSYLAARDLLGVGPVDLWADHIDGVDLWYLFPDIDALVKLRSRSIRTWGQYRHVAEDGRLTLPVDDRLHQQALVRSRVVDEVRRSWQSGRPRPISPQELRDCGHISSAFIEHVVALCKDLDGDCSELINALRNRHISGFRMKVVQDLDDYFRQEGYITDFEPLPDEMIRARAVSAAGHAIEEGLVDMHEIDTLLTSLTAAPEAVVTAADV